MTGRDGPRRRQTPYAELVDVLVQLPLLTRETRRARGLSLRAAAAAVGCSYATFNRVENGDDCTVTTAILLLHWIDVSAAELPPRS